MITKNQVTIEFATKEEADLFKQWYRENSTGFFMYLHQSGEWGREEAKKKMEEWPKRCERFV